MVILIRSEVQYSLPLYYRSIRKKVADDNKRSKDAKIATARKIVVPEWRSRKVRSEVSALRAA